MRIDVKKDKKTGKKYVVCVGSGDTGEQLEEFQLIVDYCKTHANKMMQVARLTIFHAETIRLLDGIKPNTAQQHEKNTSGGRSNGKR